MSKPRRSDAFGGIGKTVALVGAVALFGVGAVAVGGIVSQYLSPQGVLYPKTMSSGKSRRKADIKDKQDQEYLKRFAHRSETNQIRQDLHIGLESVQQLYPMLNANLGAFKPLATCTLYHILSFLELHELCSLAPVSQDLATLTQILLSDSAYLLRHSLNGGFRPRFRWGSWLHVVNSQRELSHSRTRYALLCDDNSDVSGKSRSQIDKDLRRTFPEELFFCSEAGRESLGRLLSVFAVEREDIGYTQGVNYLAGFMLMQSEGEEEECFHMLSCMFHEYELEWMFLPGLPALNLRLYQFQHCLELCLPELSRHLSEKSLSPSLYAVEWFLTLFTYALPLHHAERVWDLFLVQGWKVIFRVGLGIMEVLEVRLMELDQLEDMVRLMKSLPGLEIESILKLSLQRFAAVDEFLLGELEDIYLLGI